MKRKITNELIQWKKSGYEQSILLLGARQIGKTYVIKEFGEKEFAHLLYINFEDQRDLRLIFDHMPNPEEAVKTLRAYGVSQGIFTLDQDKTLIFLDEIQLCKRAYSLLKPLTEMKRFSIIASGSLLGINLNGEALDPGPTVKHIQMFPMDFEEFLWARFGFEISELIDEVKSETQQGALVDSMVHEMLNRAIVEYIIVGGMPQVVQSYVRQRDIGLVYQLQSEIIRMYRSDIQQYQSTQDQKIKTLKCFDSIPSQFAKENHRFMYSTVEDGKRSRDYGDSIEWLTRTGIVLRCHQITHLKGSLMDGRSESFKLYLNDVGLLVNMLGKEYVFRIQHDELGVFKGAIYEQLIAQSLIGKGIDLHYFRFHETEIDFLIEHHGQITPIECKSGGNTKSKSLQSYIQTFEPKKAIKVSSRNVNVSNPIVKAVPHYLFALLERFQIFEL